MGYPINHATDKPLFTPDTTSTALGGVGAETIGMGSL